MTSKEIAKLCGVSKTTVSRVINNDPNVKAETRQMVMAVIEQHSYVPIASARRLAGIGSNIIGLFIIDINLGQSTSRVSKSTYFSQLGNLIIDQANNSGYQVLVSIITSQQQLNDAKNLFIGGTLSSGIFIGAINDGNPLGKIMELEHPIIIVDQQLEAQQVRANNLVINLDNWQGAYDATQHLIALGHTRIGHISGDLRKLSGKARLEGYLAALEAAGIAFEPTWLCEGEFQEASGYLVTQALIEKAGVTAIFAANDSTAIGAIKAIKEMGLNVPQDISVIGFDNIEVGNYLSPALTTVDASLEQIAAHSVQELLYYFENHCFTQNIITIETKIITRETTSRTHCK